MVPLIGIQSSSPSELEVFLSHWHILLWTLAAKSREQHLGQAVWPELGCNQERGCRSLFYV